MDPDRLSSPRESTDSSIITVSRYTSRFREHMSQAFTDYPPDLPFPIPTDTTTDRTPQQTKSHKSNQSIESFSSVMSKTSSTSTSTTTSSTSSSLSKLKRAARKMKLSISLRANFTSVAYAAEEPAPPTSPDAYTMKGTKRTFRKEDIQMAGLVHSSNMAHYF
jgi:hypothetical protein